MNKYVAIQQFMSSFGLPAYEHLSVPQDAEMPYLTYSFETGYFGEENLMTVNLYYRTSSNSIPNAKATEIGNALEGGAVVNCDDGAIWIKRGSPFCQNMSDEKDDAIKIRYINLETEFIIL